MAFSLFDFANLAFGTYSLLKNKQQAEELSTAMNQQYASNQGYQGALMGVMGQREQASQAYQQQMSELARTTGEQMSAGALPEETVQRINGLVDYFVGGGEAINLGILKPQFDALDGSFKTQLKGVENDRSARMFTIANNLTGEAKTRALLNLDKETADQKESMRQEYLTNMANLNIQLTNQYMQWALGSKDKDAATKLETFKTVGSIAAAGKPSGADYGAVTQATANADPMGYLAYEKAQTGQATASTAGNLMKLLSGYGKTEQPTAQPAQVKKSEPATFAFPWQQPSTTTTKKPTDEDESFFSEQIR